MTLQFYLTAILAAPPHPINPSNQQSGSGPNTWVMVGLVLLVIAIVVVRNVSKRNKSR